MGSAWKVVLLAIIKYCRYDVDAAGESTHVEYAVFQEHVRIEASQTSRAG